MRRIPRATWIAVIVTAILTMLLSLLGNVGATALTWLSPPFALVLFVLLSLALIIFSLWQEGQKPPFSGSKAEARENRRIMLALVQNKWITGFLENKLYYDEEHLPLPLRRRVGSRYNLVLSNPLEPTQTISLGTPLAQVFDQARGELLILGAPGAGKTTLLLELARDLLQQAGDNEEAPIPVVLMLSSWSVKQLPLEQWIAEELKAKYDIPSQIGEEWVKANQLLLLLDGLDEVAPSALPACIKAINEYYYQAHRSLVVCSRTKEFLGQPGQLALHTAVMVQPLSSEQVDTYLAVLGEEVDGLKSALQQSETLYTLTTAPLILKVLILAFHGKSLQELLPLIETASAEEQQHMLFHAYVERVLQKDGPRLHATAQQTKHWLTWLACQLTTHQQSELYLERLQSDWLPKGQRAFYRRSIELGGGLLFGLSVGVLLGLFYGLSIGLSAGLVMGVLFGLSAGLISGSVLGVELKIEPVEELTWSWRDLFSMLLVGLVIGLSAELFFGLGGSSFGRLRLAIGLLGLAIGLISGLFFGSSRKQLTERSILSPNGGIRHSIKNGLSVGLGVGLVFGLGGGLGVGLVFGLGGGLGVGLVFGLGATLQHYALRFWLWHTHLFPWQAVRFLDDAVEQLLLRKVGGGYIFRHRLLQDYFASLEVGLPHDPSFRAEERPVLQNAPNGNSSV